MLIKVPGSVCDVAIQVDQVHVPETAGMFAFVQYTVHTDMLVEWLVEYRKSLR